MDDRQFCARCDVSMDLHPDPTAEDVDDIDCTIAASKADLLDQFGGFARA